MYKVLLTDNISLRALEVLEAYPEIEATRVGTLPPAELEEAIPAYDAIIVRSPTKITASVLAKAIKLKFIGRAGVGTDNVDVDAADRQGVVVMNTPNANSVSTAEHTIALMLSVARLLPHAHRSVTGGEWNRKAYRGLELCGKTLGIIGLGRVGREVAKRMAAFDMRLLATDPYVAPEEAASCGAQLVPMEVLLRESHVVTIHVPLNADTAGLIGSNEMRKMRDGVILVNCARGGVVSEKALLDALESGKIAAVGQDVYEDEPPNESPLFGHPRSVFTPHIGAATAEAQRRVATDIATSVAEALVTGVLRDVVPPPPRGR